MRAYVLGIIRDGGKNVALSSALILPTTSTFLPQAHTLQRGMDVIVNPGSADTVAGTAQAGTRSAARPRWIQTVRFRLHR